MPLGARAAASRCVSIGQRLTAAATCAAPRGLTLTQRNRKSMRLDVTIVFACRRSCAACAAVRVISMLAVGPTCHSDKTEML